MDLALDTASDFVPWAKAKTTPYSDCELTEQSHVSGAGQEVGKSRVRYEASLNKEMRSFMSCHP
eukprot:scaffold172631_cov28-Prasinocladus_malaysianus.AAC.1